MKKITRKSLDEANLSASRTDWEKIDQLTDRQIEQAIEEDADAAPVLDEAWFQQALWMSFQVPAGTKEKERISIRLDKEVLRYFRSQGKGYQSRINSILRAFMVAQQQKET